MRRGGTIPCSDCGREGCRKCMGASGTCINCVAGTAGAAPRTPSLSRPPQRSDAQPQGGSASAAFGLFVQQSAGAAGTPSTHTEAPPFDPLAWITAGKRGGRQGRRGLDRSRSSLGPGGLDPKRGAKSSEPKGAGKGAGQPSDGGAYNSPTNSFKGKGPRSTSRATGAGVMGGGKGPPHGAGPRGQGALVRGAG